MTTQTKPDETKQNKTAQNGTKHAEPKDNDLFFEVPVMPDDANKHLTMILNDELGMTKHTAVSFRVDRGKLMIGVLPK